MYELFLNIFEMKLLRSQSSFHKITDALSNVSILSCDTTLAQDRSLYTCSSAASARRGHCRRSLCTCSSPAGARRGCCRHSLCTCSSAAGARRGRCRRSLYTGSSAAGARRCCCRHSLCTGSSAAGMTTGKTVDVGKDQ